MQSGFVTQGGTQVLHVEQGGMASNIKVAVTDEVMRADKVVSYDASVSSGGEKISSLSAGRSGWINHKIDEGVLLYGTLFRFITSGV